MEQVKAAGLIKDYAGRYGAKSGFASADEVVEAAYKSLIGKKRAGGDENIPLVAVRAPDGRRPPRPAANAPRRLATLDLTGY